MSLTYYIKSQTTGDRDSVSQVLTQNTLSRENTISKSGYFEFEYPVYSIEGATFDYYGKDYNSISYDISNGKIYSLLFSANTQSLSGQNTLSHVLYRITLSDYVSFLSDPSTYGYYLNQALNTPLLSITESCSAITLNSNVYTYSFPTQYKDVGNFTQNIFEDKFQFLLDDVFGFYQDNDMTVGDAYYLSTTTTAEGFQIPVRLYLEPSGQTFTSSNLGVKTITGNTTASGYTFQGAFFTYFVPPKKPNLNVSNGRQQISVEGVVKTLSPIFNFNNTDDGDYYVLDVNYDTADTPFSGTEIYSYTINKQAGDAEFVRTFSTPLRANDDFLYRIGNTKELVNIFGNKQSITTYSDAVAASIQSSGQYNLSGTTWRNMVSDTYYGYYRMSGVTVGFETPAAKTFSVTTTLDVGLTLDTVVATTNSIDTVTVTYNGSVSTLAWQNAVYAAPGFTSLGMYVVGGNANSAMTASDFTFNTSTSSHRLSGVTVQLTSVYLNTSLNLAIDRRSSETVVTPVTKDYVNSTAGQSYTRTSDSNGNFNFGSLVGGYYQLEAVPQSPPSANSELEPITQYITINNSTSLNLVFSLYWSNQLNEGFYVLANETFL